MRNVRYTCHRSPHPAGWTLPGVVQEQQAYRVLTRLFPHSWLPQGGSPGRSEVHACRQRPTPPTTTRMERTMRERPGEA
jgi:hypothetical protein